MFQGSCVSDTEDKLQEDISTEINLKENICTEVYYCYNDKCDCDCFVIEILGTSAHEYVGEQSKYKYKFWCKFCCWPPFTVIASLVPRKLLIFPLNFGLSYFVLVSASLLVPTIYFWCDNELNFCLVFYFYPTFCLQEVFCVLLLQFLSSEIFCL